MIWSRYVAELRVVIWRETNDGIVDGLFEWSDFERDIIRLKIHGSIHGRRVIFLTISKLHILESAKQMLQSKCCKADINRPKSTTIHQTHHRQKPNTSTQPLNSPIKNRLPSITSTTHASRSNPPNFRNVGIDIGLAIPWKTPSCDVQEMCRSESQNLDTDRPITTRGVGEDSTQEVLVDLGRWGIWAWRTWFLFAPGVMWLILVFICVGSVGLVFGYLYTPVVEFLGVAIEWIHSNICWFLMLMFCGSVVFWVDFESSGRTGLDGAEKSRQLGCKVLDYMHDL